jgi:hypothetical protein
VDRDTIQIVLYSAVLGTVIGGWIWRAVRLRAAKGWSATQGTIESGVSETVGTANGVQVVLPVFAFSYCVNGEYYSGRFSLSPYSNDVGEAIFKLIVGRKIPIKFDPSHPAKWFVAERLMEGYKVEQKMGPHLQPFYPKD